MSSSMQISLSDRSGIIATIVAGALSLGAVLLFTVYLTVRLVRRPSGMSSLMGDPHMTAYFYSMLLANIFKAGSVVMSAKYLPSNLMVHADAYCNAQAGFKLLGNVGSAVWSLVIAVHIFNLLFRMLRPNRWGLPAVLTGVWALLAAGVLFGPVALSRSGPFYGPDPDLANGSPCWITKQHTTARFLLEYFPTGVSTLGSLLLLGATLLHLRGNIYFTGTRCKLRWLSADDAWHNARMRDEVDVKVLMTVKRMICFPLAYLVLWAPVAIARLIIAGGRTPDFGFVAFSLTTFALTGFVDVALYIITRRVILPSGVVTPVYVDIGAEWDDEKKQPPSRSTTARTLTAPPAYPRALILHSTHRRTASSDSGYSKTSTSDSGYPKTSASNASSAAVSSTLPVFRRAASPEQFGQPPLQYAARTILAPQSALSPVTESPVSQIFTAPFRTRSDTSDRSRPTNFISIGASTPRSYSSGSVRSESVWTPASSTGSSRSERSSTGLRAEARGDALVSRFSSPTATASSAGGRTFGGASPSSVSSTSLLDTASSPSSASLLDTDDATRSTQFAGSATSARRDGPAEPESGGTFGGAATFHAHARAGAPVEPLAPYETVKARLYGARFSLVAGPTPAYDYDRAA